MSRLLAALLETEYRQFQRTIDRLEHVSMQPSVDVRLTAEIITKVREKIRLLGLDPADTTPRELYQAVLAKVQADDARIRERIGATPERSESELATKLASAAQSLIMQDSVLSITPSALKKVLISVPPKRTMKLLKVRSIESVVKREDPVVVYALAKKIEDATWHRQIAARMKRLQTKEVSEQPMRVVAMSENWYQKLPMTYRDSLLATVPEAGSVVLLSSVPLTQPGAVLLSLVVILQAVQKCIIEAFPHRLQLLQGSSTLFLPAVMAGQTPTIEPAHGLELSWVSVYRAVATHDSAHIEDDFMLDDMFWESSEQRLARLDPSLDFWVDTHYLGVIHDTTKVLSLHIADCAGAFVLAEPFGKQSTQHLRASIWHELQHRYLAHDALQRAVFPRLFVPEEFMV